MATGSTGETRTLLLDSFSAPLDGNVWDFPVGNPSFYGRTQIRPSLPTVSNGLLHLQLDTFNPSARTPGDSFFGSEIFTRAAFFPGGGGIAFDVSARIASPVSGVVGGVFGYNFNNFTRLHDEIDFESLGNDAVSGSRREETNIYSNEPLGAGHPRFVPNGDLTALHDYRIEWFPDRVRWLIDNRLVREDTGHVPQNPLQLHLNLWAPDRDFSDAFSAALQPAASQSANTSYFFDMDFARVALLQTELPSAATVEFNGDGISDVLWRRVDANLMIYNFDNNKVTASPMIGAIGAEWQLIGVKDFNHDGTNDVLWERVNGDLMVYDVSNNQVIRSVVIGHIGTEWQSVGVGDFNGDGTGDVAWERADGSLMIYDLRDNQVIATPIAGRIGNEWHPLGVGDFNGDGTSDILWQRADGALMAYDVVNNQVTATPILGQIGSEWQLLGVGDFNGNGTSDILWQRGDGTLMTFDVVNNQVVGTPISGSIGREWQFSAIGDFNGDGVSDALFRRGDGNTQIFDFTDNRVTSAVLPGQVGTEWQLLA